MMKRAQIVEPLKPLLITEISIPKPPQNGAVIKTCFSGICHSDLNQWRNYIDQGEFKKHFTDNPNYVLPIVPGHEISGVVYSLGEASAENIKVGDRVVVYPWIGCGTCGYCVNDNTPLCDRRHHGVGIGAPGGYATYVQVPDTKFVVKVPDSVPLNVACMLPCSGLTTFSAVKVAKVAVEKTTLYKGKASLLVIGSGGLGLWCLQLARSLLPPTTKIVAADINEKSLKVASEQGFECIHWNLEMTKEEASKMAASKSYDGSYDCVIDVVNSSWTAEKAFGCSHRGSTIVMVGLFGGAFKLPLPQMVHGARTLQGVLTGVLPDLRELVQLVEKKSLTPPPIIYFSLDDAYEGMCRLNEGKLQGRGIIKYDG
ncbi:unnamed protein product [Clavelina lepadiformis]|uniref:Enoyl reductase (ER) domain-containing protein n=1 Tax=Clavelina lepadiformis TaxID=159417 RepID=A0ABP0GYC7_CLALP